MTWTQGAIDYFLETVAPPGEELEGYDDRWHTFDEAVSFAKSQGEAGRPLLNALYAMRHSVAA